MRRQRALQGAPHLPAGYDRRSRTVRNRLRRFLNNYWVVPLLVCYVQFFSQILYSADRWVYPPNRENRTFLQEVPILYKVVTTEFPYTMLGHLAEMANHWLYQWDVYQVTHEELKEALSSADVRNEIFHLLLASRSNYQSEMGGIMTLSYETGVPRLRLYSIRSANETLSLKLHDALESPPELTALFSDHENQKVFAQMGIQRGTVERVLAQIHDDSLAGISRKTIVETFVGRYDSISESRYLLSPLALKESIGRIPYGERFVGLYHFHNGFDQPPSSADIEQSLGRRQFVMTFAEGGWRFYDVLKRQLKQIDVDVGVRGNPLTQRLRMRGTV